MGTTSMGLIGCAYTASYDHLEHFKATYELSLITFIEANVEQCQGHALTCNMPCSSGAELLSSEKSSHLLDSIELKPLSPGMDATDSTMKLLNVHSSLAHHHYNVGHSIFLKRSRHYYGHQYSRRNSGNHANASASHGKITPLRDERLAFKLSGSEFGHNREQRKSICRPDRIRPRLSSMVIDASDAVKMICGICQKLLRRKPYFLGEALSSGNALLWLF
ncbi:hypothetical protein GH714_041469 [Hevea brasiliensis]|uniref:Uncharacterized protein n=1 Tax=Hevea brasiliensis TaxID=3981 RepID=A0A6A6MX95_HEVBR|nr:hypothetical protein GH714_041469 [Hevea brasiliensis]